MSERIYCPLCYADCKAHCNTCLRLACLPLAVSVGSVLLGGFLVAMVVTLSHESEEMLLDREPSFSKVCRA